MTTQEYINNINKSYKLGNATEHTYRGYLQQLIESISPEVKVTNEPKKQSWGAIDYSVKKKGITVGYIEAKNIGDKDLDGKNIKKNKEQFDRYKAANDNLIFTDYLNFHLYKYSELKIKIPIGEIKGKGIEGLPENYKKFENLIKDFCIHIGQTIKSPKELAKMMALKARLLSDEINEVLIKNTDNKEDVLLKDQFNAFKSVLIHDIKPKEFADVYSQTIVYGLFAARLNDTSINDFSRTEAYELIPISNPFLRKLFFYISGPDIHRSIRGIVDDLAEVFLASNVEEILKNYGKATKTEDPIIHFYETFLAEYDPKLKKARGVWYTPQPVVNFIVRAVDDILKSEFELSRGLADTSKTKIKVNTQNTDKRTSAGYKRNEIEVHKVQILDPAAGTGTFLAETIKLIRNKFKGQEGIWPSYVENDLIPRLNGFEILMASYAMAHLKLDLVLKESGYVPTINRPYGQRLKVYLTNSLEESHVDTGTLFGAEWLSNEANEANHIKRDTPVMCVIGNPPYSGESSNKGRWITDLMIDYKKEPGGKEKLKERNPKWINDDYVKFLRYGQHFIEKNGSGVLAFINPHGFLDNPTFRGMRWHLLKTYDKIYTIDLHGNSNIKEKCPDGSPDINVFDIQQGVAITIFIKTGKKKSNELGKVFHYDLYGKRDFKYDFLSKKSLTSVPYTELKIKAPMYYMVQKDYKVEENYNDGVSLKELFIKSTIGVQTHRDDLVVDFDKNELISRLNDVFATEDKSVIIEKYRIKETNHWKLNSAIEKEKELKENEIIRLTYRPFDERFIYYNDSFVDRTRRSVGSEIKDGNFVLNIAKIVKVDWNHSLITKSIPTAISMDINGTYFTPLYLYPKINNQKSIEENPTRTPNLNQEIVNEIAEKSGLTFTNEKENSKNTFAPIDILDYIYAVLHSPAYREKYKEFLKIDFPRVPYPKDKDNFWHLVKLGGEIRQLHLLESPISEEFITTYPINGDNVITKRIVKKDWEITDKENDLGRIWINENQYFGNIPRVAWEFYIGGYQPAQKWLKDRRGREEGLKPDDIRHYQKIIIALFETHRLMNEIEKIEFL